MHYFFMSFVEKAESLLGTAEDKETTEQESRKPLEQEVGPFPPCPLTAAFASNSFLLSCMSSHASSHLEPPLIILKGPCCQTLDTFFNNLFSCPPLPPFAFFSLRTLTVCFPSLRRPPAPIRRLRPRGRLTATRARRARKTKHGRRGAERRRPPQRRSRLPTRGSRL